MRFLTIFIILFLGITTTARAEFDLSLKSENEKPVLRCTQMKTASSSQYVPQGVNYIFSMERDYKTSQIKSLKYIPDYTKKDIAPFSVKFDLQETRLVIYLDDPRFFNPAQDMVISRYTGDYDLYNRVSVGKKLDWASGGACYKDTGTKY